MLLKQRSQQIWNWEGFCTQTGSEHCSLDSSDLQTKLMKHSGSSQAALPKTSPPYTLPYTTTKKERQLHANLTTWPHSICSPLSHGQKGPEPHMVPTWEAPMGAGCPIPTSVPSPSTELLPGVR